MQLLLRYSRQLNLERHLITIDSQILLAFPRSAKYPFFTEMNS